MQLLELKLVLVHALLKTGSHYRTRIPPLGAEGKYLPIIAGRFYCLYRHKHRRILATWLGILTQTSNEKVCVLLHQRLSHCSSFLTTANFHIPRAGAGFEEVIYSEIYGPAAEKIVRQYRDDALGLPSYPSSKRGRYESGGGRGGRYGPPPSRPYSPYRLASFSRRKRPKIASWCN